MAPLIRTTIAFAAICTAAGSGRVSSSLASRCKRPPSRKTRTAFRRSRWIERGEGRDPERLSTPRHRAIRPRRRPSPCRGVCGCRDEGPRERPGVLAAAQRPRRRRVRWLSARPAGGRAGPGRTGGRNARSPRGRHARCLAARSRDNLGQADGRIGETTEARCRIHDRQV